KQTGLEAGKELTDSSESSLAEEAYIIEEPRESDSDNMPPIIIKRKIHNENKKSVNKKVRMESERQAKRIPEGPSKKDLSNNLPSDLEELTKVFEKNLEGLENLVNNSYCVSQTRSCYYYTNSL
ncbi:hypothetical protein RclHR1_38280001, partial [Rhizophagus clarus]